VPLSAHAGFDYLLAFGAVVGGLAVGLVSEEWYSAVFLVGVGAAQAMLTASTRFTMPRSA
jgi:NADH:ubiquinone oxidoreductase subunit 6 (subunit J)